MKILLCSVALVSVIVLATFILTEPPRTVRLLDDSALVIP